MLLLRAIVTAFALLTASLALAGDGSEAEKRIAITFDDTPRHPGAFLTEDERATLLIEELRKAGVEQATFFVNPGKTGKRAGAEARIAAYVAAGHVLANHTSTHPRLSQTDTTQYLADLDAAGAWLKGRVGARPWFRFPYLDEGRSNKEKRDTVRAALIERGLLNASPTIDASDWWLDNALNQAERNGIPYDKAAAGQLFVKTHVEAAEFYHALALEAFGRPIAHNILLHETDLSAMFIGDLIAGLQAEGWVIVTSDEAFADPAYRVQPDVPSAQGTLTELVAWEEGIASQRWYPGNDTRLLEQRFNDQVIGKSGDE
ncbi:MAG: polysaccharide deacetylase family protein [Pseudomonadota bacterium]|nr:polysaccharide deacetylase family protein [Pseudomonadota bacterium]